ncbi:MAG: APC family permease [Terriglobales bacterium]
MSTSPTTAPKSTTDGLVRALGPWQSLAMVVGTLIGTGIFFVSKDMIQAVHSVVWILLAWLLGGFLSLTGALAYAELGTMRPQAGGEYAYIRDGLGPLFGFLFGWGMFWIVRPASVATIGAGFALAASFLWPGLNQPAVGHWAALSGMHLLGAGVIALVTLINYYGVRHGGAVQALFTGLKLLLVAGLTVAAFAWGQGNWTHFSQSLPGAGVGGFAAALVAALWAYDGWNDLTLAGSEIRDPGKTIPRAMVGGIAVVFLFYAGINLAYFYVLRPSVVAQSNNVASTMAARFLGHSGGAMVAVAIMISAFATLNSSILSGARVPFAMAHDGLFFQRLAHVSPSHRTPDMSLLIQALFAMGFSLSGTYQTLYTLTIFAEWLFYLLAIVSLFVFRRRGERAPYASWGYPVLPGIFVVAAVYILLKSYAQNFDYSTVGLAIILAGIPGYLYFARRREGKRQPTAP